MLALVWVPGAGRQDRTRGNARGIAHLGSVWLCVTGHPCTQGGAALGLAAALQQHTEHCESGVGSTAEESLKRTPMGFWLLAILLWPEFSEVLQGLFFFSLAWFLHYRLNPEVFSCLSFPVPTYGLPKISLICCFSQKFCNTFCYHSASMFIRQEWKKQLSQVSHYREAILCSGSKAPCNRLLETGNLPWQNAALPLVSQNECSFPETRGDKPGKCLHLEWKSCV